MYKITNAQWLLLLSMAFLNAQLWEAAKCKEHPSGLNYLLKLEVSTNVKVDGIVRFVSVPKPSLNAFFCV